MGIRAHLLVVDASTIDEVSTWSDDRLVEAVTGSGAVGLGKSWQAVFPLIGSLAGTGEFLADDLLPIGDDLGYGPAMYLAPELARAIATAVSTADEATIAAHWSNLDNTGTDLGAFSDETGLDDIVDHLNVASAVFTDAATRSAGVLIAMV